ncbi:cytochrome c oxidase subunit 3 [Pelagicoccus sp. SDUM812005]|uniref:cytochrome c oxidase subunit 3 n=1 Tax=Pelagicoccus sp. SDUM812005 TaxID=3041257 RepID=UPI00280D9FDA|nr:cytochrome c oxidase subunit 3 [Pelagicoccus sp. SDUM812005]MDQ8181079.1 cytochrome c oxidase subunit 3 [Pelagicoccus sp. SDUM812005]
MKAAGVKEAELQAQFDDAGQQERASALGMWIFLATEVLFFGVLFVGYTVYRLAYPEAFVWGSGHLDLRLGTLNTAVLLGSSYLVALGALTASGKGTSRRARLFFGAAALLGCLFLAVKGMEWYHVWEEGLFPGRGSSSNSFQEGAEGGRLFFGFYYVMTGLHALHVLIGVCVLAVMAGVGGPLGWRRRIGNRTAWELAGLYWHFVDIVWLFLFPLLYLIERSGG